MTKRATVPIEEAAVTSESQIEAGKKLLEQIRHGAAKPAKRAPRPYELIGGAQVLGKSLRSTTDLIGAIREGLPDDAASQLSINLKISKEDLARASGIPRRTLMRKTNEHQRFDAAQSDRLYRVAAVAALAETVLGNRDSSNEWLTGENKALGGVKPLELLDTEAGADEVKRLLGRIEMHTPS